MAPLAAELCGGGFVIAADALPLVVCGERGQCVLLITHILLLLYLFVLWGLVDLLSVMDTDVRYFGKPRPFGTSVTNTLFADFDARREALERAHQRWGAPRSRQPDLARRPEQDGPADDRLAGAAATWCALISG